MSDMLRHLAAEVVGVKSVLAERVAEPPPWRYESRLGAEQL